MAKLQKTRKQLCLTAVTHVEFRQVSQIPLTVKALQQSLWRYIQLKEHVYECIDSIYLLMTVSWDY